MGKTFALGGHGRVMCWAQGTFESFHCLNGAWEGSFKDGIVEVKGWGAGDYPADLLWEGHVPRAHARSYNDAIPWIQSQIDQGIRSTPEEAPEEQKVEVDDIAF